jgi:succinate dehydrogenase / fumarate reductase iron-sulfur subunit
MSAGNMKLTLKIWRQSGLKEKGRLAAYVLDDVSPDQSFLEMLDDLNRLLVLKGEEPVVFEHDCREGICGCCGLMINGQAHGPVRGTTVCQLHMRNFKNGDTIVIEPWRAKGFPVIKDLMVDRSAFDRIIEAGGYVSVNTGGVPDANAIPIRKENADLAMDAAACIGCGACVASCPNASAMLFVGAKISQYALLPQGQVERVARALNMVAAMDREGFGNCSNVAECEASCPKLITLSNIQRMYREHVKASWKFAPREVREAAG